jgi:hypothetical protein
MEARSLRPRPRPSPWMSLQLAIPWWVVLQQSPPPLRQPGSVWYKNGVASRLIFIELMNPESDKKRVRFFGNISK